MKRTVFTSALILAFPVLTVFAQVDLSWEKHVKLADQLYSKAEYAEAGEHYLAAWKKKMKNADLANKAGECFQTARNYQMAAEAWKHVKDMNDKYPLIGLLYARALKQSGNYEAASSELVNFIGQYQGTDKTLISQVVQNELRGCELAAQFAVKGDDKGISVEHLNSNVNSPQTEFAPFPFGDEALYFSSTIGKRAAIYRTLKSSSGDWGKATPLDNFPVIEKDHYCNGTLTPDATRFYFTICQSEENWGGLTSRCQIYVTRREGKIWTNPEKLPEYINEANVTTTHPNVVHQNGTEILYFSSNRQGGKGGMDIWYTTREIKSNANDFTLPINSGSEINTLGDEITPNYDFLDGTLYFASNGQITIGGFDIFKAKGARTNWAKVENMGRPLNSPSDDFSYVRTSSGKGGFLVSNRKFDLLKPTTTDEDIFYFQYAEPVRYWVARGEVYDKDTKNPLSNVEVALYEVAPNGQKKFISTVDSPSGNYDFAVEKSKKYFLEATKEGYLPNTYEFDTRDYLNFTDFGAPIYLESTKVASAPVEVKKEQMKTVAEKQKDNSPVPVSSSAKVVPAAETAKTTITDNPVPPVTTNETTASTKVAESVKVETSDKVAVTKVAPAAETVRPAKTENPVAANKAETTSPTTAAESTKAETNEDTKKVTSTKVIPAAEIAKTPKTENPVAAANTAETATPIKAAESAKEDNKTAAKVTPASEMVKSEGNKQSIPVTTPAKSEKIRNADAKEVSPGIPYVSRGRSKDDNLKILTEAPRKSGIYYKIQLAALVKYNSKQPGYVKAAELGRIDTEYIVDLMLYRVLLADFDSLNQARSMLSKVKTYKEFKDAFIVEYNDGERIGMAR